MPEYQPGLPLAYKTCVLSLLNRLLSICLSVSVTIYHLLSEIIPGNPVGCQRSNLVRCVQGNPRPTVLLLFPPFLKGKRSWYVLLSNMCRYNLSRWMHAVCQNLNLEEEVESVADAGFDCSLCRPYMSTHNGKASPGTCCLQ